MTRHVKEIFRAIQEIDRQLSANDLKPEEKVRIAINMTDVVTRVCADGVRQNNSKITDEELISVMRRRFSIGQKWFDEE